MPTTLADDDRVARLVVRADARQVDGLPVLALEGGRALLDARRLDEAARRGGQIADRELVDAARHGGRRHVHVEAQVPGGERAHELAGVGDVEERVLGPAELNIT
jgi:hypothetical protein